MATLRVEVECGEKTCDGCPLRDVDGDWCNAFGAHLLWAGTGAGNVLMRYDACLAAEVAEPEPLRCGAECHWFARKFSPSREGVCHNATGGCPTVIEGDACTRSPDELAAAAQTIARLLRGKVKSDGTVG